MKLYNSLSKTKEEFKPINKDSLSIYVCGITPYDTTHLGHAFTYISFDALIRYFQYKGYKVNYTQNVTDINDRDNDILKRAKEQKTNWQDLSNLWTQRFLDDMKLLNWRTPNNYLYASLEIDKMINVINKLLINNFAYKVNGNVYLDISKDKNYGKLSGLSKNAMIKIANEYEEDTQNINKKNPLDITLWRGSSLNQSGHIPSFLSPFRKGRPGWHIECSAMAISSLGEQIDIHGGGKDLIFPHHEAEIAQSESATGKEPFSKIWMHTGIISYKGKKMSKSLGNLVLVSDLLKKYSTNVIRFMLLSHHYRQDWEFKEEAIKEAQKKLLEIKKALTKKASSLDNSSLLIEEFENFMQDDLNIPKALNLIYETAKNNSINSKIFLTKALKILGF
jgi:L-cysteine:1D-myo-inositol 2-amino-2-deoxy-alpha-D-glucopyranoside ligase